MKIKLSKDLQLPNKIKIKDKLKIYGLIDLLKHYNSSIYDLHNWIINETDPYDIITYLKTLFNYINKSNINNKKIRIIINIEQSNLSFVTPIEKSLSTLL